MVAYDAFISYSHAKDKPIAAALQSVVQKLGKAWYQRRALRVFRDDASLSATPHLWASIEQALSQSQLLILLASPEAAASSWVGKEIVWWLDHNSADTVLIALTDGELAWDNAAGDFHWSEATPLPPALKRRFDAEPRWINLCPYRNGASSRDANFMNLAADFGAAIHGTPKEDLLSQEVRQQRRALRLASSVVALLLVLLAFAFWQWTAADVAKRAALLAQHEAIEQKKVAEAQRDASDMTRAALQKEHDRTNAALSDAVLVAYGLVGDFSLTMGNVEAISPAAIRDTLKNALALADEISAAYELQSSDTKVLRAENLLVAAKAFQNVSDPDSALSTLREAKALWDELVPLSPDNMEWKSEFAAAFDLSGDVKLQLKDYVGARSDYEKCLGMLRALAIAQPGVVIRRHMAYILARIGALKMETGDRSGARVDLKESRFPYQAKAGCPTITGRRRTREAPVGMAPALSWS